jgi:ABC-type lipoprotein export system ATPase subunit
MIHNIRFLEGFALQLPQIQNQTFTFVGDKLNVLFSQNGAGKSTILQTIKAYSAIEKGGWSRISNPIKLGTNKPGQFPYAYREYAPGKCLASVAWDGVPTFYNDGDIKLDNFGWFFNIQEESEDGITTEAEQMDLMTQKPSSGQYRIHKLGKIMETVRNIPSLQQYNPKYSQDALAEVAYINSLPRNGKPTLLLDEPERALSLPRQKTLFNKLTEMLPYYQVIIATHSPFVLFEDNVRIIDMNPGYAAECVNIFRECVARIN